MHFNEIWNISINIFMIDFKPLKVECGSSEIKKTPKSKRIKNKVFFSFTFVEKKQDCDCITSCYLITWFWHDSSYFWCPPYTCLMDALTIWIMEYVWCLSDTHLDIFDCLDQQKNIYICQSRSSFPFFVLL